MVSSKKRAQRVKSTIRASTVSFFIFIVGIGIFLTGGIGDIVWRRHDLFNLFVFFIQDIVEIIFGLILVVLGGLYLVLGCFQNVDFIYDKLRIGRRSVLHLVYLTVWPGFVTIFICCFDLFQINKEFTSDCKVDVLMIFFGFNGTCMMSPFRILYLCGGYLVMVLCIMIYIVDFVRSSTFGYFKNKKSVVGVYDFIHKQRLLHPSFTFHIECYHYERERRERRTTERDSEGNVKIKVEVYYERVKVTTYTDWVTWRYNQVADVSGPFMLDGRFYFKNFIKVKMDYEIDFDSPETRRIYEKDAESFYLANRYRDRFCEITRKKTLPGFQKTVLANLRESGRQPLMSKFANIWCYLVCCCTGCQLLFRYWFDRIAGEQDFTIRKVVSATRKMAKLKEHDQNYDIEYTIVPDFRDASRSNASTVVRKKLLKGAGEKDSLLEMEPSANPDYVPNEGSHEHFDKS